MHFAFCCQGTPWSGLVSQLDGADQQFLYLFWFQLALTGSPPQTEIFVFSNADAKDKWLTSTVQALIERTKSVVSAFICSDMYSYLDFFPKRNQNDYNQINDSFYLFFILLQLHQI